MKKKIFIIIIIFILLAALTVIYLNKVILPTKIKSLIISSLKEQTQKDVSLKSLRFSIFKGLVLENLVISDEKQEIINIKEASCSFLILPVFKKNIIIPFLRLKSPSIFLQRRKDNTFNLQDLFPQNTASRQKSKFNIVIYKFNLSGGKILFQDDALAVPFSKNIENLNLNATLLLPAKVKFSLKTEVSGNPALKISLAGEYKIPQRELAAKISLQDLSAKDLLAYFPGLDLSIPEGFNDALIDVKYRNNIVYVEADTQNRNLKILKGKLSFSINSQIKAKLEYALDNKGMQFSGKAVITDAKILGLEFADNINSIAGEVNFSNSGISCDKLTANVWGLPVQAAVSLTDFQQPNLSLNVVSNLSLASLRQILNDQFRFSFPGDVQGQGNLSIAVKTQLPLAGALPFDGYLDITDGVLKLNNVNSPFAGINGKLEFNQSQVQWKDLGFRFLDTDYVSSGELKDFKAPIVQLALISKEIALESNFTVDNKLLKLERLTGKYLNSDFSLAGGIGFSDPSNLETDINGDIKLDLQDLTNLIKQYKGQLEQIKPKGIVQAKFNVSGNLSDFKSCEIQAKVSSPSISAYGLSAQELLLDYSQVNGIIDMPVINLSLYDGLLQATAKMNLKSENLPYTADVILQGVRIEKLKLDTAVKDKDIAGNIALGLKLNGYYGDISKLSGAGNILVSEGKLWGLNLFKGIGALIFSKKDFTNIVFSQASCDFLIQDKAISTNNLMLKSNVTNLSGPAKIGFDGSLDASLSVHILDDMVPLSGTIKDITTAIAGQAGVFGLIKIDGTLKEPKYHFKTAVTNVIKGLTDIIFGR